MARAITNDRVRTSCSDRELVTQCQQGDCDSFRLLYQRYQQRVRSTLDQLCGEEMLDDLVQEVFLRAWKGLPKLKEINYFSTWLYRISWNVAVDRRKQLARQNRSRRFFSTHERSEFTEDEQNPSNQISDPQNEPNLMQLHYQDLVRRGLQTLSLEHRAVLVLHDLEDLSQKEVSNILNIPVGTVKSRLFYARNAVKKFLQQQGVSL